MKPLPPGGPPCHRRGALGGRSVLVPRLRGEGATAARGHFPARIEVLHPSFGVPSSRTAGAQSPVAPVQVQLTVPLRAVAEPVGGSAPLNVNEPSPLAPSISDTVAPDAVTL